MRTLRKSALFAAGCALLAAPLLARALPDDSADDDKDKTSARKELRELEEQRSRLDEKIRAARKRAGLSGEPHAFAFGNGDFKMLHDGFGDHQIIIRKALEGANESVREALKNIPKFEQFDKFDFNFDLDDKDGKSFKVITPKDGKSVRIFTDKDGKVQRREMTDEEKKKFKEQMEKMKIDLHEHLKGLHNLKEFKDFKVELPEIRAFSDGKFIAPRVITPESRVLTIPRVRGGGEDRELRDEIRSLREEVERLRDEVKRGRGGKSTSTDVDPFGTAI
jgi:hypothetical protein